MVQDPSIKGDVLIAGAGPSGCATAVSLARAGAQVTLLHREWRGGDRVETLSTDAAGLVAEIVQDDAFLAQRRTNLTVRRAAWFSDSLALVEQAPLVGRAPVRVDRRELDALLLAAARKHGVAIVDQDVRAADDRFGSERIVIDATGRNAVLARRCGANRVFIDRLVGLQATVRLEDGDDGEVLVEALTDGWWFSCADNQRNVFASYFMDGEDLLARRRGGRTVNWIWQERLLASTHTRQRLLNNRGPAVKVVSASSGFLDRASGTTWLAVGDAALSMDPLSSSGVEFALTSGVLAARAVLAASRRAFDDYERFVQEAVARFRIDRHRFYGAVRRFEPSPFWTRRSDLVLAAL